jgi:hypothetical protein
MRTIDDLNELEDVVAREPAVYVRYSQGPDRDAHGTSRDYEAGLDMPGLSVTALTPERWWTRPAIDWLGEGALRQARQCYHERFDAGRGATD